MNFQLVFLTLNLVAGGYAFDFQKDQWPSDSEFVAYLRDQKSVVKENAGVNLLEPTCVEQYYAIVDTMNTQGCFNTSWNDSLVIYREQLATQCARCDIAAHVKSLETVLPSCLDELASDIPAYQNLEAWVFEFLLVRQVSFKAAECVTDDAGLYCAAPLTHQITTGYFGNFTQTKIEGFCGTSCYDKWYTELVATSNMLAECNMGTEMAYLYCLKDADIWCRELYWEEVEFCASGCSGAFFDRWDPIYKKNKDCYAKQGLSIDPELRCRQNSQGDTCMDLTDKFEFNNSNCNLNLYNVTTWTECNASCKADVQAIYTDYGCCGNHIIEDLPKGGGAGGGEKEFIAAADWIATDCSITATATCDRVITAATPTKKPTGGPTEDPYSNCLMEKCEKELNACAAIPDCITMLDCHGETDEEFDTCTEELGFTSESPGHSEAKDYLGCAEKECADLLETPSSASTISGVAVIFITLVSTFKFL